MDGSAELDQLLGRSSDPENPDAEGLRALLGQARRVAVIGTSRFPDKPARRIPSYLAAKGYEVVPVNPYAERIFGRTAYPTLGDVPGEVDLVIVFRPSSEAGIHVRAAAGRPERPAIWLQEGIRADVQAAEARGAGLVVVQDLCVFHVHRLLDD